VIVHSPRPGEDVVGYIERPVAVALALIGPKPDLNTLAEQPHACLVIPLGAPGAPAGTTSALVLTGAGAENAVVLPAVVVLLAAGLGVHRRRRTATVG
jgi:hypothetical protein